MPWQSGSHAAYVAGGLARDAVVSGVSPASRTARAAPSGSVQHGVRASPRSGNFGRTPGTGVSHSVVDQLLHLPSMSLSSNFVPLETLGGRSPRYWRSLEEYAGRLPGEQREPDARDGPP